MGTENLDHFQRECTKTNSNPDHKSLYFYQDALAREGLRKGPHKAPIEGDCAQTSF